jgi:hypothetical protein
MFASSAIFGKAESLTANKDYRNRFYLRGVRDQDGSHVYSGGIDAAIKQVLAYAAVFTTTD